MNTNILHEQDLHYKDEFTKISIKLLEYDDGSHHFDVREMYLDFDEEWQPTPKGVRFPVTIPSVSGFIDFFTCITSDSDKEMLYGLANQSQ